MADSMAEKCKKLTTSIFFSYPKLFTSKVLNEAEALRSPTSILDSKPFLYGFKNPFWSETNSPETTVGEHKHYRNNLDSKGLVDALVDINDDNKHGSEITSKSQSRMILFGSQLKIQIPPSQSQSQSPTKSEAELGINIRNNSQLEKSAFESANSALEIIGTSKSPDRAFSATEMVLREEYTRVISHRPNPRTTHIFDIESSCFHVGCSSSATENVFLPHHHISYPFLSFCFYCKKNLGHGIDIYMYRGERAFCSNECRYQGMLLEEGMGELEARDAYGNGT